MKCYDLQNNQLVILDHNYQIIKIKKYDGQSFEAYISLPWVDIHTHCNPYHNQIHGNPDWFGVNQGVGYIFDAGSTGVENFKLWKKIGTQYQTKVKILLNISKKGILNSGELKDLSFLSTFKEVSKLSDQIAGIKIRISPTTNIYYKETLISAQNIARKLDKPLMIHIGNKMPNIIDILKLIDYRRTIITHAFNGKDNNPFHTDEVIKILQDKIKKGLYLDVGHGSESFGYETFKKAMKNKIFPTTISTDIYSKNYLGTVFSLASVMSKILALCKNNNQIKRILDCVTINPAQIFSLRDYPKKLTNEFTIFQIKNKLVWAKEGVKNKQAKEMKLNKIFVPILIKQNGKVYKVKEGSLYGKLL